LSESFNISTGLLLSGTVFSLLFAYLVRFVVLSFGPLEAGFLKMNPKWDEVCQQFGLNTGEKLKRVHFPLLRKSIVGAFILVFVDVMKELPATLMLRPFNFNTLATRLYEYTSDEMLRESSLWGVSIVLVGLAPLIFLNRAFEKEKKEGADLE
jgi:iron(III) transport system permease protein